MKHLLSFAGLLLVIGTKGIYAQDSRLSLDEAVTNYEAAVPPALLDRQAFTIPAALKSVLLSPNGTHLAYLTAEGHDTALHLYELATGARSRLFSSANLSSIYWTSDGSHLILDLGSAIGAVTIDQPDRPAYIAKLDPTRDEQFLGSSQPVLDGLFITGGNPQSGYILEQVDLNGVRREVVRQEALIVSAFAAGNAEAVIVESATSQGHQFALVAEGSSSILFTCALLETCDPLVFQENNKTLWLQANTGGNLIGLMAYSVDERELVAMHSHAEGVVDLFSVVIADQQPRAVQYHDGLVQNYGLDEAVEMQLRQVQASLPASAFTPQISSDGRTWLVRESSSLLQHPRYHLFDTQTGRLSEILQEERDSATPILPAALSQRIPIQYQAEDTSVLHGYVSLPKGRPLDTTPMITLVHGGPIGRIYANYDEFVQFLVNRGYIVFEANFRASTGYGRNYVERAANEFGDGLVQQDIIDGVHYLISQGVGDSQRLAIAGHSFGGSAVLAGLAFTPGLFKAGFASAAAADMAAVLQFQRTPERRAEADPAVLALLDLLFGAPDDPAAMQALSAKSPQAHLARIMDPLLLIAGADDMQVPVSHVKDYALVLLNLQKTFSLFVDKDEGHGIGIASGRSKVAYFWMAEEFFGIYLGGNKQPLDDPALAGYIRQNMLINTNPDFSPGQAAD